MASFASDQFCTKMSICLYVTMVTIQASFAYIRHLRNIKHFHIDIELYQLKWKLERGGHICKEFE